MDLKIVYGFQHNIGKGCLSETPFSTLLVLVPLRWTRALEPLSFLFFQKDQFFNKIHPVSSEKRKKETVKDFKIEFIHIF